MRVIYSVGAKFAGGGIGDTAYQAVRGLHEHGMLFRLLCGSHRSNEIPANLIRSLGVVSRILRKAAAYEPKGYLYYLHYLLYDHWKMKISVVIPTHNRKEKLRRCLLAVTAREYPDYEVIVVDDGSIDGAETMALHDFPQVDFLRLETNQGPAAARNMGIRHANGAVIAFTDDDCVPPPDWLVKHAHYHTSPQIGAVGGNQIPEKENFFDRFDKAHHAHEYNTVRAIKPPITVGGLYTNNLSIPKMVLDRVGLFDVRFLTGQDTDLTRRISQAGYLLIHDPRIRVTHLKVHTFRSYCRMRFLRGCGIILTDVKERTLSPKRFVPLPDPVRTWKDWTNYRALYHSTTLDFIYFWGLALISRLVGVAGRFYYYFTVGRHFEDEALCAKDGWK